MSSRVIQLWHGSPLKRIGFDAEYIQYSLSSGFLGRILSRLLSVLAAWSYKQYSVIVAPHERVASRYQTAFRVPLDRILVTGDPRCDRLVGAPEQQMALKRVELYRYWGLSDSIGNTERIILYAPTWRDGKNWQPGPPPEVSLALQDMLAQTNARLIIRAHPYDGDLENALDGDSTRLHYIPAGKFPNINEWLVAFDVLISDYSGIAMDWTILGRPLLLFPYDLSQYESERGLYESYREFAGQEWCSSWMELIDSLRSLILDGDQRGNRISKHILNRYQAYSDGQNCHRLLAALTDNV
jgi:CDP-glycerol glycerophosphotransferase